MIDISSIQQNFYSKIFVNEKTNELDNSFKELFDLKQNCLGEFGSKLIELSDELDTDHPEIKSGKFLFDCNVDVLKKLKQLIELYKYAESSNLNLIVPNFHKITKFLIPEIKSNLHNVKNKQMFIRLLKSKEDIQANRLVKQSRIIELPPKKTVDFWDKLSNIEKFVRFGNIYESEICVINEKINIYKQLRMQSMIDELELSKAEFKSSFDDHYFGFQRAPVLIIAIMLAKFNGGYVDKDKTIKIPNLNNKVVINELGTGSTVSKDYPYSPMVYPIHCLEVSEKMNAVISHLDAFPESDNKPIFDNFLVIVPGIYCQADDELLHKGGKKRFFHNSYEVQSFVDKKLIEEKQIIPVLMGEKEGKCYFLCFWE